MNRRGFTLIEVMIAMVIFMVGVLAVLQMSLTYIYANERNRQANAASVGAQDKIEQIKAYATSDRVDKYSVFDFDYLISEIPSFTTVLDPATNNAIEVNGLLSGSAGGDPVTTPWGMTYEVLYDDGSHGDETAGDEVYTNSDEKSITNDAEADATTLPEALKIHRMWTVAPYRDPANPGADPDYAMISVTSWWIDKYGDRREFRLESCINRRQ